MTVTVEYKCEKCGHVQSTPEQFWELLVHVEHYPNGDRVNKWQTPKFKMQVCRPCLESFGINVQKKAEGPTPVYPTIEDLITEIVQSVLENQ